MRDILTGILFKLSYSEDPANNVPFGSAVTDFNNIAALPTLTINSQQLDYETYDSEYKTVLLSSMSIQPFDITVNYVPTESSTAFLDRKAKDRSVFQVILNYRQDDGMVDFAIVSGYITGTSVTGSKDDVVRKSFRFSPEEEVVSLRSMAASNPLYEGNFGVGSNGTTVPQYEPLTPTGNSFIKIPASQTNNPASADMMGVGLVDGSTFSSIAVTKSGVLGVYAKNSNTAWTRILTATQIASQYLPLTGGTISGTLTLNNALAVSSGGTGAKTAADARANLGLGSAALKDIGYAGDKVPVLNVSNYFTNTQNFESIVMGSTRTGNTSIEMGSLTTPASSFIDFHSSGNNIDYDSRIIATGGSTSSGRGDLQFQAANIVFQGTPNFTTAIPVSSGGTGSTNARDARTALGFDEMGIGMSSQVPVNAFDWQTADFVSGGKVLTNVSTWLNAPADLKNPNGDVVDITCVMARTGSSRYVVTVTSQATTSNARYNYSVVIYGAKGTRQFAVTQKFNSDQTTIVPIANGGTGANNATQAMINLKGLILRGEMPTTANIDNYGPNDTYTGIWGKNSSVGATIANGFPEENAVGMLEVFPYNQYQGMQRYTVRGGNEYIRNLTGSWNGSGPWSEWYSVGGLSMNRVLPSTTSLSDATAFSQNVTYILSGERADMPAGLTAGQQNAIIISMRRTGGTIMGLYQEVHTTLGTYVRYGAPNASSKWTTVTWYPGGDANGWRLQGSEAIASIGYGLDTSSLVTDFDWQRADFNTGVIQSFVFSASLNRPSNIVMATGTSVTVQTIQTRPNLHVVRLTPLTSSNSNRREYIITISGSKGARTFISDQVFTSAESTVVPVANGGTGANNAEQALANLGAFPNRGNIVTGTDLNTLDGTVQGVYYQTSNSNATAALNYPAQVAGTLLVLQSAASSVKSCTQTYYRYNSSDVYTRTGYASSNTVAISWGAWVMLATTSAAGVNNNIKVLNGLTTPLVPVTRTINGKPLSGNITLSNSDISGFGTASTYNIGNAGATVPLLSASNTWSGTQSFQDVSIGANRGGNVVVEIGSLANATAAVLDFHSSGFNNDYDSRIMATGGTDGSSNGGTLQLTASTLRFSGAPVFSTAIPISSGGTGATNASTALSNLGGMPTSGGTFTGAVTMSSTVTMSGAVTASSTLNANNVINQNAVPQGTYCQTALSTGTASGKNYLRSFRGGNGSMTFHETVQGNNYRIASGTTDTTDALTLSNTGDLTTSTLTVVDDDATLPAAGNTVYGGKLKSLYTVKGVEKISSSLEIVKRIEWNYSIARLTVKQAAGNGDTAQSNYFDFMSTGDFYAPGRLSIGAPVVSGWWDSAQTTKASVFVNTATDTPGTGAIAGLSWGYRNGSGYDLRTIWGNVGNGTSAWGNTAMTQFGDNGAKTRYWYFTPVNGDLVTSTSGDGGFAGNYTFQKAATSDATLKHDIEYNDGKQSYENIKKLKPCTFVYNFDESNRKRRGIIAQDALRDIDSEYVKLVPAAPEYNDEGERIDKDDTLALDNNVIMMDTALGLRYNIDQTEQMQSKMVSMQIETDALKAELAELKALILSQKEDK